MKKYLVSLLMLCTAQITYAQTTGFERYRFADYSSGKIYRGKHRPVQIPKKWQHMHTRIKNGQSNKIDFASHYKTVIWGCGTQCVGGVMIDARTGKVHDLITLSTEYPLHHCHLPNGKEEQGDIFKYRANSRLFITANCNYEEIENNEDKVKQHKRVYIYEWQERQQKFRLIKTLVRTSIVPVSAWH